MEGKGHFLEEGGRGDREGKGGREGREVKGGKESVPTAFFNFSTFYKFFL